ncbi:hypothetical protein [Actinoalloteichus caeruleus]|uniref:Uncharacterized protein n=1 Tax=Actinoalloteichus caeruleus DSM 43889 TaxID=1120930 RepID=A0ABT1JND2_ACTCY|nr:hypothetical protein [Actinoalloteichus caeruleus]MCP2334040.1 hypothetical protein [Actinoalloteichus caeruleus DSM 43889]
MGTVDTDGLTRASPPLVGDELWGSTPCPAVLLGRDGTPRALNGFPAADGGARFDQGNRRGWSTRTPVSSPLITHPHREGPDVVALSRSIATRLPTAHATVTACHADGRPVIVGGAPCGADGRYAEPLGAHAWARDAREAADLLAARRPPPPTSPATPSTTSRAWWRGSARWSRGVPRVSSGPPARGWRICSRLSPSTPNGSASTPPRTWVHIIGFLVTAPYLGGDELFHGFLDWASDVLAARDVPLTFLVTTLDPLATELREPPARRPSPAAVDPGGTADEPEPVNRRAALTASPAARARPRPGGGWNGPRGLARRRGPRRAGRARGPARTRTQRSPPLPVRDRTRSPREPGDHGWP